MTYEYKVVDSKYHIAEFVGTYKVILRARPGIGVKPIMVAKVENDWWICDRWWDVDLNRDPLADFLGQQLDNHYEQYINDLIVGPSEATARTSHG